MSGSTHAARDGEADRVRSIFAEGASLRVAFAEVMTDRVVAAAHVVVECFQRGGKLLLFGNGGSASDAQHGAAEIDGELIGWLRAAYDQA